MCSFDIVSLFTNIPIDETINICLDELYKNSDSVNNLSHEQFRKLLNYSVKQNHFMFEDRIYDQIDGVAMGSPLGPVLANIFMSHLERKDLLNIVVTCLLFTNVMLMTRFLFSMTVMTVSCF